MAKFVLRDKPSGKYLGRRNGRHGPLKLVDDVNDAILYSLTLSAEAPGGVSSEPPLPNSPYDCSRSELLQVDVVVRPLPVVANEEV